MQWQLVDTAEELSRKAAERLLSTVVSHPTAVLGLPTGRTPIGMYRQIVEECKTRDHCLSGVTTFNLDEYVGIAPEHPGSYFSYMRHHLFDQVDLDPHRTNIPNGDAPDLDEECRRYEDAIEEAGGLTLTFLGLGRNGHIGFNEPGTPPASRTRVVDLSESTRKANAPSFPGAIPAQAITMGIGTILESRSIVLLVSGEGKQEAMERLRSGVVDIAFPASALWQHHDVTVLAVRES